MAINVFGVANLAVITIGPHIDTTNTCILEQCTMQLGIDVVIGRTKNEESLVIEDGIIANHNELIAMVVFL
jgi:hypothetical protein